METETTLPLSANPTANASGKRPGRRPLILVVDDDRDAGVIYREYLRAMGCRVVTASDGALGIEKATRWRPDVIVMDLAMPHIDGWTATKRLRQQAGTRHIPIVALTAAPTSRHGAHAAGMRRISGEALSAGALGVGGARAAQRKAGDIAAYATLNSALPAVDVSHHSENSVRETSSTAHSRCWRAS